MTHQYENKNVPMQQGGWYPIDLRKVLGVEFTGAYKAQGLETWWVENDPVACWVAKKESPGIMDRCPTQPEA